MRSALIGPAPPRRRAGFTLIELLVVMGIILILASLALSAVFNLREAQMKSFTETAVQKLASALDQQWKAELDQINDDLNNPKPNDLLLTWAQSMANGEPRRARVIYIKARLKQAFPVTFYQALYPYANTQGQIAIGNKVAFAQQVLPPKPTYARALAQVAPKLPSPAAPPATTPIPAPAAFESSALLYLALNQGRRGMAAFRPEEVVEPSAIQDRTDPVSGTTFKVFVDSWGNPLRYYIFPYYSEELNGTDPQDPENMLQESAKRWPQRNAVSLFLHPFSPSQNPLVVRTLGPVVASAGRDGDFGDFPGSASTPSVLDGPVYMRFETANGAVSPTSTDNIYSFRLRQLGRRGD